MPHKKFQHFIKWFDIFIRAKKNMQKKKGKIKQKIKEKDLPDAQAKPAHPAHPAQRGSGVFFPALRLQAARWNATEPAVDATSSPRAFQASPCPLPSPGDASRPSRSIPPPPAQLPPSPCRVRRRQKNSSEHRSAPAWPSTPRSPSKMSSTIAVLGFVD